MTETNRRHSKWPRAWHHRLIFLLLFWVAAGSAYAQKDAPEKKSSSEPSKQKAIEKREQLLSKLPRGTRKAPTLDDLFWKSEYEEYRPDESVLVLSGGVRVEGRTFRLRAENVVFWIDPEKLSSVREKGIPNSKAEEKTDDGLLSIDDQEEDPSKTGKDEVSSLVTQLYAEGGVEYRSGSEIIRADRVFFDLRTDEGLILDGYLNSYVEARKQTIPIVVRADEIHQYAEGKFRASDTSLSNCAYGRPHWHLHMSEIDVQKSNDGKSMTFSGKHAHASFQGIPFFYLPYLAGTAGSGSNFYFKSARVGKTSRFGFFGLTEWGDDILLGKDKEKFGEWTLHLDLSEDRGFGSGLDIEYQKPDYFGELLTYRIHDEGREDKGGIPVQREERSRIRYRHRHFLPDGFQIDLEGNWFSDRNFQSEFFEKEFKEEKAPETVAYVKRTGDHHMFTLTGRFRLNDFQTQTEYLPRATYDLIFEPVLKEPVFGTNVYYSQRTELSNVRIRFDEDIPDQELPNYQDDRILRGDTIHRFDLPIPLGPVKATPFQQVRYSAFEETARETDSQSRFSATGGIALSTKLSRVFDTKIRPLKIRGLRHVVTPRITYSNTFENNVDPNELIQFDTVDRVEKRETIRFELRNRLQTRRGSRVTDLINFNMNVDFFPKQDRDNIFPDPDQPGDFVTRAWGNLDMDLVMRLTNRITVRGDAEYDFYEDTFPVTNAQVTTQISKTVRAAVGYRGFKGQKSLGTAGLQTSLGKKWSALLLSRYDFRINKAEETEIILQRNAHEWIIEMGVSVDEGENDTRFTLSVQPRALFQSRAAKRDRIGTQPGQDLFELN